MKKCIRIYSVLILFVFLTSCKGKDQTDQQKDSRNQLESDLLSSILTITEFNTIAIPNAPRSISRKIKKDKEGNLLIATYEDIIRYDGKSFTNFPKQGALDSFDAFDVLEDKKGNIWIASTHLGVFRHDGKSLTRFTTDHGLAHNRSMCIYEDKAGNIWIGGQGGASCYDGKSFRNFTTNEGFTHNDVNTIMEDKTGKIWFGTRGNVCVYDPSSSPRPAGKTFTEIRNDQGVPFTNVWSIIEDKKGNIWLGGQNGLWRYDGNAFTNLTTISVMSVYEDKKGNVWFTHGTPEPHKAGFSHYDQKSLLGSDPKATEIFIGDGMFFGITEDKDGDIWVGNLDGVLRYDGKSVNYFRDEQSKSK